jgi:hypothetical protein
VKHELRGKIETTAFGDAVPTSVDAGEVVASFELVDDLTQGQLESYEARAREALDKAKVKSDAVVCRAVLAAAFSVGMISEAEGCPANAVEIATASAHVAWWMSEIVSKFVTDLKTVPPNS